MWNKIKNINSKLAKYVQKLCVDKKILITEITKQKKNKLKYIDTQQTIKSRATCVNFFMPILNSRKPEEHVLHLRAFHILRAYYHYSFKPYFKPQKGWL